MGNDVTITVPAEMAGLFRDNVLHHYEMRADSLDVSARKYALEDDDERRGPREDLLAERDKLHAVEPILDQTDWTNGREAPAGALEITGSKELELLWQLLNGCLCDTGSEIDEQSGRAGISRELTDALDQAKWLVAKLDELGDDPVLESVA